MVRSSVWCLGLGPNSWDLGILGVSDPKAHSECFGSFLKGTDIVKSPAPQNPKAKARPFKLHAVERYLSTVLPNCATVRLGHS